MQALRSAVAMAGLQPNESLLHSLRTGGVTHLSAKGIGWWRFEAYNVYVTNMGESAGWVPNIVQ